MVLHVHVYHVYIVYLSLSLSLEEFWNESGPLIYQSWIDEWIIGLHRKPKFPYVFKTLSPSQWWFFVSYLMKVLSICNLCQPSRSYCVFIKCFGFILSYKPNPDLQSLSLSLSLSRVCVCVKGGLVGVVLISLMTLFLSLTLLFFSFLFLIICMDTGLFNLLSKLD